MVLYMDFNKVLEKIMEATGEQEFIDDDGNPNDTAFESLAELSMSMAFDEIMEQLPEDNKDADSVKAYVIIYYQALVKAYQKIFDQIEEVES